MPSCRSQAPAPRLQSGGNGASFQRRLVANLASTNNDSGTRVAAPYWVKIERKGDAFTGFISPDGVTWTQLGTAQTIAMGNPVYIGLAVTSHVAGAPANLHVRQRRHDGQRHSGRPVRRPGMTSASPAMTPLRSPCPSRMPTGAVAAVTHPNPRPRRSPSWDLLESSAQRLRRRGCQERREAHALGGRRHSLAAPASLPSPMSARFSLSSLPAAGAIDVTDADDLLIGEPNDGDWPAAELPAKVIDDLVTTKFLHFKGELSPPASSSPRPSAARWSRA